MRLSSSTSKTKNTSKHKTFSFVCEVPLRVTDQQERILAARFEAVQKVSFGNARKVRFKGKRGLHSLEGKTNAACIRWRENRVWWNGLELPMIKGVELDPVIQHGLSSRVKYVRLVRQNIHGNSRYYVQLVCEGIGF